jgi:hypothetical protein
MREVVMSGRNDYADDDVDNEQNLSQQVPRAPLMEPSQVIRRILVVLGTSHEPDDHQHDHDNHENPNDPESTGSYKHVALPSS